MDKIYPIMNFIQKNMMLEMLSLMVLFMVLTCVSIHHLRNINHKMTVAMEKIKTYLEVISREGEEKEAVPEIINEKNTENATNYMQKQKEQKQQEAVLEAVLQEIFP